MGLLVVMVTVAVLLREAVWPLVADTEPNYITGQSVWETLCPGCLWFPQHR